MDGYRHDPAATARAFTLDGWLEVGVADGAETLGEVLGVLLGVADAAGADGGRTAGPATGPYTLLIGQGYDPRWTATMDGVDLGRPQVVDGYSTTSLVERMLEHVRTGTAVERLTAVTR